MITDSLSDTQLIAACRKGEAEAWDTLVARYERLVYTIPLRYGLPASEADDVFQSVWLALLRHLHKLKQPERLSAWLVTTARRECWERRRGAEHERTQTTDPDKMPASPTPDPLPETLIAEFEQHKNLRQATAKLNERCRQLLYALYYDPAKPNYAAIATRLEMPAGAVGPNRSRCLKKLRELLVK